MLGGSLCRIERSQRAPDPAQLGLFRDIRKEIVSTGAEEDGVGFLPLRGDGDADEISLICDIRESVARLLESLDSPESLAIQEVDDVRMGRVIEPRIAFGHEPSETSALAARVSAVALNRIPWLTGH